ncbi:MAG TPA: 3-phosphoglycerate dehydrogenase, partial [Rhodocyclaceae bacterium]|nr:3-phosphoglycerate dehydrogenase [Rhodocyclaceae bacterium]
SGGCEIGGKVLGLLGFGNIGRLTAHLAAALGMRVLAHDPLLAADAALPQGAERVSLERLLAESDVLSLHVPLTAETRGLLDRERLRSMKRSAILIDTARGGIVDEAALAQMLKDGKLGGAALDVFAQEPLGPGSPWAALAGAHNVILTPHIAGVTVESNQRVSALVAHRVAEFLRAGTTPCRQ